MRTAAFAVHLFTAMGAALRCWRCWRPYANIGQHVRWLGVALIIDAVDGPLAQAGCA